MLSLTADSAIIEHRGYRYLGNEERLSIHDDLMTSVAFWFTPCSLWIFLY